MKRFYFIFGFCVLILMLYLRFKLGLVRYFDIDEFAHLHWGYDFFSGRIPYKNFLYIFPPGFLFALWPVFKLAGSVFQILILGRVLAFSYFIFLNIGLFLLIKKVRNTNTSLLTLLILSFLPLPYDKFLEIRPDTLSTALAVWATYFMVKLLKDKKNIWGFWSGLFYSLSVIILPKVAIFLLAAVLLLFLTGKSGFITYFILGLLLPLLVTFGYLISTGDLTRAIYLIGVFSGRASAVLGKKFPMRADLFFYPNDAFYGDGGINIVLISNLVFYVVAIVFSIVRLVSFLDAPSFYNSLIELLIPLIFLGNLFAYIDFFPLKHVQYLIAVAPFVSFYCADLLFSIGNAVKNKSGKLIWGLAILILIIFMGIKSYDLFNIKKYWTNRKTFEELAYANSIIPPNSYVFDLYGGLITYKDPYYICCIPYGQYAEAFAFKIPSLEESFNKTGNKYIFLGDKDRIGVLPPEQIRYIKDNFVSISQNPSVWKLKNP